MIVYVANSRSSLMCSVRRTKVMLTCRVKFSDRSVHFQIAAVDTAIQETKTSDRDDLFNVNSVATFSLWTERIP